MPVVNAPIVAESQVCPFKFAPSQSSPESTIELPHVVDTGLALPGGGDDVEEPHPTASDSTTPPHTDRLPSNVNFDRALSVLAHILMFESIFLSNFCPADPLPMK